MGYKEGIAASQQWLMPYSIEEWIEANNPVRVIEAYVNSLPMEVLGFIRAKPRETGRPGYDPRDMLKLYIYGYLNGIRSSRRLMRECGRNVELFYLLGMLRPDFRTIADFRKDNRRALEAVFKDFVSMCAELKLLGKKTFAVDGTKIRAVNSKKKSYTPEILDKKLGYIREQEARIEEYLRQMDEQDAREKAVAEFEIKPKDMPRKLEELRERKKKYEGYRKRMEETGEKQILETDPECRTIHTKEGLLPAYNIQTVVDDKCHMITNFRTTNANTDQGQLGSMAEQIKEELRIETAEFIADKGYESRTDIEKCIMNGVIPNVGFKYDKEERVFDLEYIPAEIDEQTRKSCKPEDIQTCLHAGVLPSCYENSTLSLEVQHKSTVSCFIRHEDGRVTCPTGKEFFYLGTKKYGKVYGSHEACRTCPNRCTDSKNPKEVLFGNHTTYVPVYIYGKPKVPLQVIPDVQQSTPYNHFGRRKQAPARVRLTIRRDMEKMQKRKELVEHPFGTIKWYDGAHYFLCKGKEKVSAEIALSFLTYDLRRAINILGVGVLLAHLRERKAKNRG